MTMIIRISISDLKGKAISCRQTRESESET